MSEGKRERERGRTAKDVGEKCYKHLTSSGN